MFTISLAMIVRDEERCLARCLASARDLVDEVIVLDTGSVDRTVEIAREHGASVHHFTWVDDFAAARNAAIAHTTSDWVLMLDADEWLEDDAGRALLKLRQTKPDFVGQIEVRSAIAVRTATQLGSTDVTTQTTTAGWIPRLLPAGVGWVGAIHEQPDWDGPIRRTSLRVGHDGYAPKQVAAKRGRNAALLRAEVAAHPDDAYLLLQLGRALESDADSPESFDSAASTYTGALALIAPDAPARHDLIVRLLFTLGQAGRTAEALDLAEAEMPHWGHSPDFFFCLGDLLLAHGIAHPEQSTEVLPAIEGAWLRCLAIGERPDLVGAVAGRGSHLAAHNLTVLYESIGQPDRAARLNASGH